MNAVMLTYGALVAAIVCEVIATSFLQQSQQFTRLLPTLLMALFYGAAFYLLSITLRTLPVGVAYAIWSGLGIVLISAIGYFVFRQTLDLPAVIGLSLIIAGVVVVNVFSKTVGH
ncbi:MULTISPECIES: DMT family transporter [Rhizobium/Agrobacterium group]|uniref:DMT family transporter n=1 Tax=Rhizobium/Agrobacterium group TaxID=227290 RepID=UPI00110EBF45|nr:MULTISPECIES: multidrug efflux SMR transporter [Rhizobium/Agrobacterium group]NWJ26863.1 multidrug efflux SMR transporter [Rhizobium sp. RM]TMV22734.1 multidrug efflux SMR transporter [Rhizobium sp. Td3]UXS02208.1 multidrug efflux SMR transporter [Agrobacterium tumefaciens]